jgi:thymidylate synthase
MIFEPKFFGDQLRIINPVATIGVVTLWSPIDNILRIFENADIDLNKSCSKIAVIGNLYGEGFRYLLRNLLFNPQIQTLIVFGRAMNQSKDYLIQFFQHGVEPYEADIEYVCKDKTLHPRPVRIAGTDYIMDNLITNANFKSPPFLFIVDKDYEYGSSQIKEFLKSYEPGKCCANRVYIEAPEVKINSYPSNVRAHVISEKNISLAWKMLVHRIFRFGQKVKLQKGERIELQNLKVVIEEPVFEQNEVIKSCGFQPEELATYQKNMLLADLRDSSYSYGNRIRSYFGLDCLEKIVEQLNQRLDDRKAYISLWDNEKDISENSSPCLVSLFFRKQDEILHLSATYRTHNAAKAWFENVYGLMAIQKYVAKRIGIQSGSITVISLSISLDPMYLEKMSNTYDNVSKTPVFIDDPNGYFRISINKDKIVVEHYSPYGFKLGEYKAKKPGLIQQKLYRDCAISDINHAIYIGRQLEKAYQSIQNKGIRKK